MRRVMIVGAPGSGKSTLARALGERLGVPVTHLDRLHHGPGWVPRPAAAFAADVTRAAAGEAWVIEGNYLATAAARLARADTLVRLEISRPRALWRVLVRTLRHLGRQRADSADGCIERFDPGFVAFVWNWPRTHDAAVTALAGRFAGRVITLRSAGEVARFPAGVQPAH